MRLLKSFITRKSEQSKKDDVSVDTSDKGAAKTTIAVLDEEEVVRSPLDPKESEEIVPMDTNNIHCNDEHDVQEQTMSMGDFGEQEFPMTEHRFQYLPLMFPSPEACQIRTLMAEFEPKVRERFEIISNANPPAGSMLVELMEQFKVFKDTGLISHGQQQNMSLLVDYVRSYIKNYRPRSENDFKDEYEKDITRIIKCLKSLETLSRSYSEPGWVYRLAIDSDLKGRLEELAKQISRAFENLGSVFCKVPNLENTHKILMKQLKNYGNGCWSVGLATIRDNPQAMQELAGHLCISTNVLFRESYFNMNEPWALHPVSDEGARKDESKYVFQEYCDNVSEDGLTSLLSAKGFETYWIDSNNIFNEDKMIEGASKLFVRLDMDFDGHLTNDEFESSYLQRSITAARSLVRLVCGLSGEKKIRHIFDTFAMFGMGSHKADSLKTLSLDSARFAKLCRDSNLISKPKHVEALDIVFSRCVPQNCKKMDFEHFLSSFSRMSVALGLPLSEICKRITSCPGPTSRCTKSSFVKLHDDRSLFTGVYARGGPDVGPVTVDMKSFVGRIKTSQTKPAPGSLEITLPESPTMATASRITLPGPRTPGRGASLEACKDRKSKGAVRSKSKGKTSIAFGRGGGTGHMHRRKHLAKSPVEEKKDSVSSSITHDTDSGNTPQEEHSLGHEGGAINSAKSIPTYAKDEKGADKNTFNVSAIAETLASINSF